MNNRDFLLAWGIALMLPEEVDRIPYMNYAWRASAPEYSGTN